MMNWRRLEGEIRATIREVNGMLFDRCSTLQASYSELEKTASSAGVDSEVQRMEHEGLVEMLEPLRGLKSGR
jgi:ACT domain-containing protein